MAFLPATVQREALLPVHTADGGVVLKRTVVQGELDHLTGVWCESGVLFCCHHSWFAVFGFT